MRHLPGKNSPGSTISTLKNVSNKRKKNGQLQQLTELGVRDIPKHHTSSHAIHKAKKKPASTLPLLPAISFMVGGENAQVYYRIAGLDYSLIFGMRQSIYSPQIERGRHLQPKFTVNTQFL
jgi:hypothetical protein